MNVKVQSEYYSVQQCKDNPNNIYVFGDNLIREGKGGQAVIRDQTNTFGIPTKRLPTMNEDAFFSDQPDELIEVLYSLYNLTSFLLFPEYTIVIPKDGIGTGLARLKDRSPKIYSIIKNTFEIIGAKTNM